MRWRPRCRARTPSRRHLRPAKRLRPAWWRRPGGKADGVRAAACCLGIALLALLVVVLLADRTFFLPQAGLKKSPAVLADKAEHIIAMLAAESGDREHRQGFAIDRGYLQHVAETREPSRATDSLPSDRAAAVCFWYRMGDEQIELPTLLGEPFQTRVVSAEPPDGPGSAGWRRTPAGIPSLGGSRRKAHRNFPAGELVVAVSTRRSVDRAISIRAAHPCPANVRRLTCRMGVHIES